MHAPIKPQFDGAWIGAVIPPLLTGEFPDWYPAPARGASQHIVLVLDGLGWEVLQHWRTLTPCLQACSGIPITSVSPSTTSTGLTSIMTGLPPGQHGITGYRMRIPEGILRALSWSMVDTREAFPNFAMGRDNGADLGSLLLDDAPDADDAPYAADTPDVADAPYPPNAPYPADLPDPPEPEVFQPVPAFGGTHCPVVFNGRFIGTPFTRAHMAGSDFRPLKRARNLPETLASVVAEGHPVTYAYLDDVDKMAHRTGWQSGQSYATIRDVNKTVERLLALLPPSVCVTITADHGLVDVDATGMRDLDIDPAHLMVMAGESRCKTLWAMPGHERYLLESLRDTWADQVWVLSREELMEDHWLSPGPLSIAPELVPDVTMLPFAPIALRDPLLPSEHLLKARHGSATAAEMLVPLICARGTKGS